MRVQFIHPESISSNRKISPTVRRELSRALRRMMTPVWPVIAPYGSGGIKRPPFDVPQAWMNHILHRLLTDIGYDDEVGPFFGNRPESILPRPVHGLPQAIDFERSVHGGNRHVIEVECGNVASMFRSIHKLCMALRYWRRTTAILLVPSRDLIARCDNAGTMSSSANARIILSEFSYYCSEATMIHIVEFSSDDECNLQEINDNPELWRGNWSNDKEDFLNENLELFIQ